MQAIRDSKGRFEKGHPVLGGFIKGEAPYSGELHPMYGKHHSEETKLKISKANKGKGHPITVDIRAKISLARKDAHFSPLHKKHLREAIKNRPPISESTRLKMRKAQQGERNHCWQGGTSFEPYTPEFNEELKEQIRERDNYTCQICSVPETECLEKLAIHHVDYDKQNNLGSNLISLCNSCHSKTNHNRKYWQTYFRRRLKWRKTTRYQSS